VVVISGEVIMAKVFTRAGEAARIVLQDRQELHRVLCSLEMFAREVAWAGWRVDRGASRSVLSVKTVRGSTAEVVVPDDIATSDLWSRSLTVRRAS
jgi:hypothetical protein